MTFRFYKSLFLSVIAVTLLYSCSETTEAVKPPVINPVKIKDQFIKANQQVVAKEMDEMDYYQKSHRLPFIKTGDGIRYYVYKPGPPKSDAIQDGAILRINYTVSLLDGTECYSSKADGVKEFKVGMDNLEDGLHKAVLYLKANDKALIMIPSHLAHGLLGDSKKIPPQVPIIYDIEILSVTNPEVTK